MQRENRFYPAGRPKWEKSRFVINIIIFGGLPEVQLPLPVGKHPQRQSGIGRQLPKQVHVRRPSANIRGAGWASAGTSCSVEVAESDPVRTLLLQPGVQTIEVSTDSRADVQQRDGIDQNIHFTDIIA